MPACALARLAEPLAPPVVEVRGSRQEANLGRANPIFDRLTERNWAIVAELEAVAKEAGRTVAQVAVQWVARQAGVRSVILGATRLARDKPAGYRPEVLVAGKGRRG